MTSDTEGFLSQISTVEKVSENQNSVLQDYQRSRRALAAARADSSKTDLAALAEQEKQLKALRTASDKKIAESKAVLAKLTAEERRKIADEERRAAAAAQAKRRSPDTPTTRTRSTATKEETRTTRRHRAAAAAARAPAPWPTPGPSWATPTATRVPGPTRSTARV